MVHKPLLIVGLDPGTTIGYAILDLDGSIPELGSSRVLDQSSLIDFLTKKGLPVMVATDRKNAPSAVSSLATKLGCRLYTPKEDLLVRDKLDLAREYEPKSDHERDALAAALIAAKSIKSLLDRIDRFAAEHRRQDIVWELKRLLILYDFISIKTAAELLTRPKAVEHEAVKKVISQKDPGRAYLQLLEKNSQLKRELELIRSQRDRLKEEPAQPKPMKIDMGRKIRSLLHGKSEAMNALRKKLQVSEAALVDNRVRFSELNQAVMAISRFTVLKKLENLGKPEFSRKRRSLRLADGDILYVSDASVFSKDILDEIRGTVSVIVTGKPSRSLIGFMQVPTAGLAIKDYGDFALVDKTSLQHAIDRRGVLDRVIGEYREERSR